MKRNLLSIVVALLIFPMSIIAQTKGVLYKSNRWADIPAYGSWTKAMDNPKYENVEILVTTKEIKVTRGKTIDTYQILKKTDTSSIQTVLQVQSKGKTYELKIFEIEDSTYFHLGEVWMVEANNTNRRLVE